MNLEEYEIKIPSIFEVCESDKLRLKIRSVQNIPLDLIKESDGLRNIKSLTRLRVRGMKGNGGLLLDSISIIEDHNGNVTLLSDYYGSIFCKYTITPKFNYIKLERMPERIIRKIV